MTVDEVCILAEHFERILELRKKKKKKQSYQIHSPQDPNISRVSPNKQVIYHFKLKRPDLYNSGPQAHVTSLNRQDTEKGTVPKENKY